MTTSFPLDEKPQFVRPPGDGELRVHNAGAESAEYVSDPGEHNPLDFTPELVSTIASKADATITGPTWLRSPAGTQILIYDD